MIWSMLFVRGSPIFMPCTRSRRYCTHCIQEADCLNTSIIWNIGVGGDLVHESNQILEMLLHELIITCQECLKDFECQHCLFFTFAFYGLP